MRLTKLVQGRFDKEHRILKKVCDLIPVGIEQYAVSSAKIGEAIDEARSHVDESIRQFEKAGIVSRRKGYRTSADDGKSARGIIIHMTLNTDYNRAKEMLDKHHAAILMAPSQPKAERKLTALPPVERQSNGQGTEVPLKVALNTAEPNDRNANEILRASAGPDPDEAWHRSLALLRKDEHYALVEAVRQYVGRREEVSKAVRELETAGIRMKVSLEDAFDFSVDERMESIGLVLPYIDQLERYSIRWARRVMSSAEEVKSLKGVVEAQKREINRIRPMVTPTVVHSER